MRVGFNTRMAHDLRDRVLTRGECIARLRTAVESAGSLGSFSAENAISRQYVGSVLTGTRHPGPGVLKVLGLRKIDAYVEVRS